MLGGSQNGCIICSMADVLHSTQSSQCPTKPVQVYSKLKQICRHLVHGHQEDAHEFLRYLMESMEKAFLSRYKNSKEFEQYTKETTPINQILGGYLRTSVKCLSCQYESVTFQHFEDLLLDIRRVNTIDDALKYHFERECLEDMDYTCESCKKKVSATKQFSLERAPVALCIQLKRFSGINGKINKHINISQDLDLSQYSSRDMKSSQLKYRLVSMITHLGSTPQCGHYTAIGCSQDGSYYQFDDTSVRAMSNSLLNTNPYIIFYELVSSPKASTTITSSMSHNENSNKRTETSTQFIGPLLPSAVNQLNKSINGCAMKPFGSSNSNGFTDNRKLMTISSNQMIPHKKTIETSMTATNGNSSNSSNETFTKNVDKSWTTKITDPLSVNVSTSGVLQISQSTAKRIIEPGHKSSNETVTKNAEDSSDSDADIPSPLKLTVLPSMPELKSTSPTTLRNGDMVRPTNGQLAEIVDSNALVSTHKETMTTNSLQRKLPSSSTSKGTVAVYVSPAKTYSSSIIQQRSEENRKLISVHHRDTEIRSTSLPTVRQTINPFSKVSNTPTKNGKHKTTNGYGQHGTYNQRNVKPNNVYGTSERKSLVPYACHDDSDSNNEDQRKSPPIVRTKAGPFQVTTSNGNNHRNAGDMRLSWPKSGNGGRVPSLNTWNGSSSLLQEEVSSIPIIFVDFVSPLNVIEIWKHYLLLFLFPEQIINEQRENNKRKLEKDFDADLDIGRMKQKRSSNGYSGERDNPNYNAFQEHQNRNQRGLQQQHNHFHRRRNYNNNYHHNNTYRMQYAGGKRKY